jgi:hypothetical protein
MAGEHVLVVVCSAFSCIEATVDEDFLDMHCFAQHR